LEKRKRGEVRYLGSIDKCVVCGKEYVVKAGAQKYCPICASEAIRRVDAQQGIDYYNKNKEIINPIRNERRRVKERKKTICVLCGAEFEKYGEGKSCPNCRATYKKISVARSEAKRRERRRKT
jgi:rubrerythrin